MKVKSVEISNELGQSLPGLQIYLNSAQILNLNHLQEDPKELVAK